MRLFTLFKTILLTIHQKGSLINLEEIREHEKLFILRYIHERGSEQEVLAHELQPYLSSKKISETFYGYLLWIAGELMNNVFDHAQTYGKVLRGGILAVAMDNARIELAVGDLGIGIRASLEKNEKIAKKIVADGASSITKIALQENVSGWPHKRGNGLPDVLRIVEAGDGLFYLSSDQEFFVKQKQSEQLEELKELLPGVIASVALEIKDFTVPRKAKPRGKVVKLKESGIQLSGRDKGQEVYEKLVREFTELPKDGTLLIDLGGVIMMNTSFGDQALGVLLENIKAGHFGGKKVYFTGEINEVVDLCLDRVGEIRGVEIVKV